MSREEPIKRRSNFSEMPVSYGAVGASKVSDLMKFPPEGMTPFEESIRLGSGQERFLISSTSLMTWGAQKRAGYTLSNIELGDGGQYSGITYSASGEPVPAQEPEVHFGPDGVPYLTVGTRVSYARSASDTSREMLVIYTIDEPRRAGFAWGSTTNEQAIGEELFTVEYRADESVWAVARGFVTAPSAGLLGLRSKSIVKDAIASVRTQIEALAPGSGRATDQGA